MFGRSLSAWPEEQGKDPDSDKKDHQTRSAIWKTGGPRRSVLGPFFQPIRDGGRQILLHLPADVHADVSNREGLHGVVGAPYVPDQSDRGRWGHQVILLCVDIQDGHSDLPEIDRFASDLDLALDQLVPLIEILHELPVGLPGLVRAVEDPLLHTEKVEQLLVIVQNLDQVQIFSSRVSQQSPRLGYPQSIRYTSMPSLSRFRTNDRSS